KPRALISSRTANRRSDHSTLMARSPNMIGDRGKYTAKKNSPEIRSFRATRGPERRAMFDLGIRTSDLEQESRLPLRLCEDAVKRFQRGSSRRRQTVTRQ